MNKKKLRIYGAGGHSQVIREVLEENGCEVTETFDDKLEGVHHATKNPTSGARGDVKRFPHEGYPVIIAVGINSERAEIAEFLKCEFEKAIHHTAFIASSVKVGEGTVVFAGAIIQPNTIVGRHVIINTSASIDHDNIIDDFAHISPKVTLCGHVEIGKGTHVGANAVVIPKVKIGKWCTIGAGAVVIKDVPDYSTVVGSPGRIIKTKGKTNNEKKVRIYGAGGHSQVVREILEDNGYEIAETFDDKPQGSHYASKNITFGARGDLNAFPHKGHPVIIAVGINKDRSEIANFLNSKFLKVIHKSAIIAESAVIGEGTVIIAGAIVNANAVVGKHVLINTSASVGHDCVVSDFAHISPKVALCGHVEVGEGSHVGVGTVVIPKVKIGKWCTIGAGTVIIEDVPDYTTVVGNPGAIIKNNSKRANDMIKSNISDITFIGSGISCSYTILHLLKSLENNRINNKLSINIIEKYSEFNTGLAYGSRSGSSVLLITSLRDFLPELELNKFIEWLNNNKKWLLNQFKKSGGSLSKKWLQEHALQLEENQWEDLFIPRSFFGIYMTDRLKRKIEILKISGLVEVNYINAEVLDIEKGENLYDIHLNNNTILKTKKTVLSIGSLPINYLWKKESLIRKDNLLFVNNPYNPNLDELLGKVKCFLEKNINKKSNVLIVGTNASGLELLYKLNDVDLISCNLNKFTFLSTQGLIPNATVDEERKNKFIPIHLNKLEGENSLKAKDIADAAFRDLDYAEEIELGAASTVGKISTAFGSLLHKLDKKELKKFACSYGNEIGRRQRCAGDHYLKTIDALKDEGRFKHIAGRFKDLKKNERDEYQLEYLDTESQEVKILDEPINLVINCVGSMNFSNENIPELIKNLIDKKYCIPNDSGIGFEVNNDFEVIENLHVIGPLLAGNIIDDKPIWHVEHCGRINWLSKLLADKIVVNV